MSTINGRARGPESKLQRARGSVGTRASPVAARPLQRTNRSTARPERTNAARTRSISSGTTADINQAAEQNNDGVAGRIRKPAEATVRRCRHGGIASHYENNFRCSPAGEAGSPWHALSTFLWDRLYCIETDFIVQGQTLLSVINGCSRTIKFFPK